MDLIQRPDVNPLFATMSYEGFLAYRKALFSSVSSKKLLKKNFQTDTKITESPVPYSMSE
jgi:hypothetical protein